MYKKKKGFISLFLNNIFFDQPKNQKELLMLIKKSKKNKFINSNTYNIIKGAINIEKQTVKDIMIPRTKIVTLKINDTLNTCLKKITNSSHSRFPVINYNNNYISGFLMAKDLLKYIHNSKKKFSLKKILRPPVIVPESQSLNRILKEFRIKRNHLAIVVDEFGVITGLITIEDVLEIILKKINKKLLLKKK
ncbi:MAG: CBS domain-containing protein [Buchnera aphidicola (Periphyllus aceris)]|nr:CBS domain-containing protein [Buchnera aphidicola (Periphyllus aceris)]